jgi:hypothetical protein
LARRRARRRAPLKGRPTSREKQLAELAEKNKLVTPQCYDIRSKNEKARRVVHDFTGRPVTILPGELKRGVLLHPNIIEQLSKGDLEFTPSVT